MEDQKENNLHCECENWCDLGRPPILKHKWSCKKYRPISEMLEIITDLTKGIQAWAADEDGVHPDCWKAYSRAKICIGQFDHIQKQIETEQELTEQERAVLKKDVTPCPVCGAPWDMAKHNACSCGAVLKKHEAMAEMVDANQNDSNIAAVRS